MKRFILGILTFLAVVSGVSVGAPEPAIIPSAGDWTINITFEPLQSIDMDIPAMGGRQRFWYTILTLTNNTNRDVNFYPKCDLMTDTFQIIPAFKGVPDVVFDKVKSRHQIKYPFLESLEKTDSKLLQGSDNAKDIVIIWKDFDPQAKNVSLFISGLSNEIAIVNHPIATDEKGNPKKVFLRKTLELDYALAGDPAFRSTTMPRFKGKDWVMR